MTELEKIKRAKTYIEKLANGIDPITENEIPDDSVLNNERILKCFSYVADILQQVAENGGVGRVARNKFEITQEQKIHIPLSNTPVPVSVLCDNISSVVELAVYRRLSHNKVAEWLAEKGYLQNISGSKRKTLTDKSSMIGITREERISQQGKPYTANVYNKEAQQFIIDHLDEILTKERE